MAAAAATAVTKGNGGGGARAGAGEASGSRKKKGPGPLATAYLVIYNVVMTAGWLVIAVGLVRAYLAKGSYHSLYYSIEKPLKFFQTGALLEILHCAVENLQAFTEFVPGDKHCAKHREYKYQQTAPCSQAKDTNMKPSVTKVLPKGYGSTEGEMTVLFGTLFHWKQIHLCFHRIIPQLSYLSGNLILRKDSTSLAASVHSSTCPFPLLALFLWLRSPAPVLRFSHELFFLSVSLKYWCTWALVLSLLLLPCAVSLFDLTTPSP
ncbi:very-long-chain (3R)-3-hydroxyacyl-CoA dehydratase 2 isoform X1 [Phocoena sinus]|uniref:very-long-chain (3R)-3-hydroxyacyl-CoA dehydratase 2 isoform X1 n=1 Tax=Phocoena sinus TaxID=42100 RepID=UPI0013C4ADA7|nr:very-long-chain (3R)-3-hydroxyacyl-CoA dehydratase 2 isoform X1 [Phocoena sinus]